MVVWNRASILEVVVSVIPNTEGERSLAVLLDASRTGKDRSGARDVIGLVVAMPGRQQNHLYQRHSH
ncbi:tail fiber protein [Pseudomonas phage WP1]